MNSKHQSKKTIIPVMSIILLILIIAIFAMVIKTWSGNFSSKVKAEKNIEITQIKNEYQSDLLKISNGYLYFNSDFNNLSVDSVSIDEYECSENFTYANKGLNKFNISTCLTTIGDGIHKIQLFTDKTNFQKSFKIKNLSSYN